MTSKLNLFSRSFLAGACHASVVYSLSVILNPIIYGILRFRQLRGEGGSFLARIQKTRLRLTD